MPPVPGLYHFIDLGGDWLDLLHGLFVANHVFETSPLVHEHHAVLLSLLIFLDFLIPFIHLDLLFLGFELLLVELRFSSFLLSELLEKRVIDSPTEQGQRAHAFLSGLAFFIALL